MQLCAEEASRRAPRSALPGKSGQEMKTTDDRAASRACSATPALAVGTCTAGKKKRTAGLSNTDIIASQQILVCMHRALRHARHCVAICRREQSCQKEEGTKVWREAATAAAAAAAVEAVRIQ